MACPGNRVFGALVACFTVTTQSFDNGFLIGLISQRQTDAVLHRIGQFLRHLAKLNAFLDVTNYLGIGHQVVVLTEQQRRLIELEARGGESGVLELSFA